MLEELKEKYEGVMQAYLIDKKFMESPQHALNETVLMVVADYVAFIITGKYEA